MKCAVCEKRANGRSLTCSDLCKKKRQKKTFRKWYMNNKEAVVEKSIKWRRSNPERSLQNARNWVKKNRIKVRENNRRWAKANPENKRKNMRRWMESRAEKIASLADLVKFLQTTVKSQQQTIERLQRERSGKANKTGNANGRRKDRAGR